MQHNPVHPEEAPWHNYNNNNGAGGVDPNENRRVPPYRDCLLLLVILVTLVCIVAFEVYATMESQNYPDYELGDFSLQYFNLSKYELSASWNVTIICKSFARHRVLAVHPKDNYVSIGYRQHHNILAESTPIPDMFYVPARSYLKINLTASVHGKRISPKTYTRINREIEALGGVHFEVHYYGNTNSKIYWFEARVLPIPH